MFSNSLSEENVKIYNFFTLEWFYGFLVVFLKWRSENLKWWKLRKNENFQNFLKNPSDVQAILKSLGHFLWCAEAPLGPRPGAAPAPPRRRPGAFWKPPRRKIDNFGSRPGAAPAPPRRILKSAPAQKSSFDGVFRQNFQTPSNLNRVMVRPLLVKRPGAASDTVGTSLV